MCHDQIVFIFSLLERVYLFATSLQRSLLLINTIYPASSSIFAAGCVTMMMRCELHKIKPAKKREEMLSNEKWWLQFESSACNAPSMWIAWMGRVCSFVLHIPSQLFFASTQQHSIQCQSRANDFLKKNLHISLLQRRVWRVQKRFVGIVTM